MELAVEAAREAIQKVTINPFEASMGSPAPPAPRVAVDAAVLAGFRLIRREPLAVLAWGLVAAVFTIASVALFAPVYADMLSVWRAGLIHGPGYAPPGLAADSLRFQGLSWLLTIASLILRAILVAAVCRAVQRPNERRFGYLRLGMAEFFLLLIYLGFYLATIVAMLLVVFVFAVATVMLSLAHAWPAAVVLDVIGGLAAIVGLIYLALRLSLIAPLVVADDKPHLAASWSLTRGHAGALFLVGLCLIGMVIAAEMLIVGLGPGGGRRRAGRRRRHAGRDRLAGEFARHAVPAARALPRRAGHRRRPGRGLSLRDHGRALGARLPRSSRRRAGRVTAERA